MAERPFIDLSIMDLEVRAKNHWNNMVFLKKIRKELTHRKTKRAKKLLASVRSHLTNKLDELKLETKFCSECGDLMEIKFGKHGMFWGCTGYPHCTYSVKITKDDW